MRRLDIIWGLFLGTVLSAIGCGPPFVAASTGTGGADGGGGTGSAGSTSTGTPLCMAGSCSDGNYCDPARGCVTCKDFGTFVPGEVKSLGIPVLDPSATPLYPRIAHADTDLLFAQVISSQGHIKRTMQSGGTWMAPGGILGLDMLSASDTGPFFLAKPSALNGLMPADLGTSTSPVLLFHTTRDAGKVEVWGMQLTTGALPEKLQLPVGDDYVQDISIATQVMPPRLFWLHGSDPAALKLATMTAMESSPQDVNLTLDTCEVNVQHPWVTPDGTHLLFAAKACDKTGPHLYIAELTGEGKQMGNAGRIFPGDASSDYSPSLSTDQCTLLFSRQDQNGKTVISQATRQ